MERRVCTSGVDPLYYIARITPYYDTAGKISGVVATFVDISSLTRSEEYVRELHADRLRSMAEMATGLAHELNQPLSAIATYLKAIRRLLQLPLQERPASVDEALDHATDQIMRAGKIIRHLREFVADGEPNMTHESLHNLIREVFELTIGGVKEAKIQMALALNANKDSVLVDKVQIKQVLVNLIFNASEAIGVLPEPRNNDRDLACRKRNDPDRRFGHRTRPVRPGQARSVRTISHDEGTRAGRRPVDLALDRRGPLRKNMGQAQSRRRRGFQLSHCHWRPPTPTHKQS